MYLALRLKQMRTILIFSNLSFILLIPSLVFSQKKSSKITEVEARIFMEEFLAFSSFGYQSFEDANKEFLKFLSPELANVPIEQINFQYAIGAYKLLKIHLPFVEVLSESKFSSESEWNEKIIFELCKKKGELFIKPQIEHYWSMSTITSWKEKKELLIMKYEGFFGLIKNPMRPTAFSKE